MNSKIFSDLAAHHHHKYIKYFDKNFIDNLNKMNCIPLEWTPLTMLTWQHHTRFIYPPYRSNCRTLLSSPLYVQTRISSVVLREFNCLTLLAPYSRPYKKISGSSLIHTPISNLLVCFLLHAKKKRTVILYRNEDDRYSKVSSISTFLFSNSSSSIFFPFF